MKKIAIFTEDFNGPKIYKAAVKFGYIPYMFLATKPKNEFDYPYYILDPLQPLNEFSAKIESIMEGKPDAVISCIEQFCVNIAKYTESIGVEINKSSIYEILRNKNKMKEIWLSKGVTTANFCFCKSFDDIDFNTLSYPLIVKPSLGAASAGVRIVYNEQDLRKQIRQILRFNITTLTEEDKHSGFLVEEYISGEEFSVDTIWFNGEPVIDGIMSKGNPQGPLFPDRLYLMDPLLKPEIKDELLSSSHNAVKAAGVKAGATHTEIRVKNGKGYVIESALRPGAGSCFYDLFEKALGVSFYEALVIVSLSDPTEAQKCVLKEMSKQINSVPTSRLFWYNMGYKGSGIIKEIRGEEKILSEPFVNKVVIRKKTDEYLSPECDSFIYFGWIFGLMEENDFSKYYEMLENAEKQINIMYS